MPRYSGPVIDTDIHHIAASDAGYLEFYPERTRPYAEAAFRQGISFHLVRNSNAMTLFSSQFQVAGSAPDDGGRGGSSYAKLRDMILDPNDVYRGCLTYEVGEFGAHLNPYFASDLCRAANDWTIECWLRQDERLHGGIVVGPQTPDEAVAEIRRLADHPQMSFVCLGGSALEYPLGHPLYHPIYAAAAEAGLPIVVHVGAYDFARKLHPGGRVSTLIEKGSLLAMPAPHYVSSFITHGVFEKYPTLRVLLNEFSLSWLPTLLWNLERDYELLRLESPWVKRRPSEYVHDHVRFSTQPLEATHAAEGRRLVQLLETVDGVEDLLCFSTDFPHGTMDDMAFVERILPSAWHSKVFCENACAVYGWTPPSGTRSRRAELAPV
jgi:predicted TIM-barrel fold metal-dependent hydrolase